MQHNRTCRRLVEISLFLSAVAVALLTTSGCISTKRLNLPVSLESEFSFKQTTSDHSDPFPTAAEVGL